MEKEQQPTTPTNRLLAFCGCGPGRNAAVAFGGLPKKESGEEEEKRKDARRGKRKKERNRKKERKRLLKLQEVEVA